MSGPNITEQPDQVERLGEYLIVFCWNNIYISDNRHLFIAPEHDFCRACFQRRYSSQHNGTGIIQVSDRVLKMARSFENLPKENHFWRWFLVEEQKAGKPFELIPFEDCPVCGKGVLHSRDQAAVQYEYLMNQESVPRLDELRNQVFSFGFARGLVSDNQIGSVNPEFNIIQGILKQILGDSYHARIIYRMVASDGRYVDDTSTGFAPYKSLAELKSMMEYLERYAFMLGTSRLRTKKYDDQLIDDFLSLYCYDITEAERRHIQSHACWGINLCTSEIRAIPVSFICNEGQLRFIQPTTNGFGAHIDFKKSLCNSILELVERDAFMRFWYDPQRAYKIKPDVDVVSAIDSIIAALRTVLHNDCLAGNYFIIKSPTMLPVVMVTISSQDYSRPPALCFGYGAGYSIQQALLGAVKELRINASNLVKAISFIDGYLDRKFNTKIENAPDRMNLYSTSTPREKLRFLDSENLLVNNVVEEAEQGNLDAIVERFRRADLDIYGLDFTPECFQDKNVFVTRAFSPQLYPLQFVKEDALNLPSSPLSVHTELPHFFL